MKVKGYLCSFTKYNECLKGEKFIQSEEKPEHSSECLYPESTEKDFPYSKICWFKSLNQRETKKNSPTKQWPNTHHIVNIL